MFINEFTYNLLASMSDGPPLPPWPPEIPREQRIELAHTRRKAAGGAKGALSKTKVAKQYGIPKSTLVDRTNDVRSKSEAYSHQQRLTSEEDAA